MDTTEDQKMEIEVERLDDIPIIFGHLRKMKVQEAVDSAIEAHGNWQGLSHGWVVLIWLIHILTEHNHCMDNVREWVRSHAHILSILSGQLVRELDFTDDRLALCLRQLSDTAVGRKIELFLGSHMLRVYDLGSSTPIVRLDATTEKVHHDPEKHPMFQVGKGKNGIYEVQYKLMLASLDPLGLPLAIDALSGDSADDPLYIPAYLRVKEITQKAGMLMVGDSKMSALETRAVISVGDDFYLTPLKKDNELLDNLLAPWVGREEEMIDVFRLHKGEERSSIARGFEATRTQQHEIGDETEEWKERLLIVYSEAYAKSMQKGLDARLDKAEEALKALTPPPERGKRQIRDEVQLKAFIKKIEKKYRVENLFVCDYKKEVTERQIRGYKNKPSRTKTQIRFQISVNRNHEAIAKVENRAGWRIYASNAPEEKLPFTKAILAYRNQYIAENIFRRLKGDVLVISPLYIHRDDHAKGLFLLLTLAARVLALGDYLAKTALAKEDTEIAGLYPGNPKRSTATPTTERILKAFAYINLVIISVDKETRYQITPLTEVQERILELWDFSPTLYTQFATGFAGDKKTKQRTQGEMRLKLENDR
ncbi:MAG: IS1634 family transposase [Deltaproteobacteria bacterium]|nr:MAG: IS1634 family transposase [Deltaproteobacteria bacterium]